MSTDRLHHPSGPLQLAVALAVVAGFVDAHLYQHLTPVFVANMSGNLIHLGMLTGAGDWAGAAASLVALGAFLLGVVAATVHHDREVVRGRTARPHLLLRVEAVLVLAIPLLMAGLDLRYHPTPSAALHPVLVVAAFAMGMQAAALRRVGEIAVATTYGTGAIVRIGEKTVLAARRADRASTHRRRVVIATLVVVLVAYVAGAAIASVVGGSPWWLLAPSGILAASHLLLRSSVPAERAPDPVR